MDFTSATREQDWRNFYLWRRAVEGSPFPTQLQEYDSKITQLQAESEVAGGHVHRLYKEYKELEAQGADDASLRFGEGVVEIEHWSEVSSVAHRRLAILRSKKDQVRERVNEEGSARELYGMATGSVRALIESGAGYVSAGVEAAAGRRESSYLSEEQFARFLQWLPGHGCKADEASLRREYVKPAQQAGAERLGDSGSPATAEDVGVHMMRSLRLASNRPTNTAIPSRALRELLAKTIKIQYIIQANELGGEPIAREALVGAPETVVGTVSADCAAMGIDTEIVREVAGHTFWCSPTEEERRRIALAEILMRTRGSLRVPSNWRAEDLATEDVTRGARFRVRSRWDWDLVDMGLSEDEEMRD